MSPAYEALQPYTTLLARPRRFRATFPDQTLPYTLARLAVHTVLLMAICLVLSFELAQALPPFATSAALPLGILSMALSALWIASVVWLVFRSREPNWFFYATAELVSVNIALLALATTLALLFAMMAGRQVLDPSPAVFYSLGIAVAVLGVVSLLVGLLLFFVSLPLTVSAACRVNGFVSFIVLLLAGASVNILIWGWSLIAPA